MLQWTPVSHGDLNGHADPRRANRDSHCKSYAMRVVYTDSHPEPCWT